MLEIGVLNTLGSTSTTLQPSGFRVNLHAQPKITKHQALYHMATRKLFLSFWKAGVEERLLSAVNAMCVLQNLSKSVRI